MAQAPTVDLRAMVEAANLSALKNETRLTAHEDECARRYTASEQALTRVHDRLDALGKVGVGILVALITLLGTAVVQIAMTGGSHLAK